MLVSISREPNLQRIRLDIRVEGDGVRGDARAYVEPGKRWMEVSYAVLERHAGETKKLHALQRETALED